MATEIMHSVQTDVAVLNNGKLFTNLSDGKGGMRCFTDEELVTAERFCRASNWYLRMACYGHWQAGSHKDGRYSSFENFCNERLHMGYDTYRNYAEAFSVEIEVFGPDVIEQALKTRTAPILSWTAVQHLQKLPSHDLRLKAYEECRQLYASPAGPKKMQETNLHIQHVVKRLLAPPAAEEPTKDAEHPKRTRGKKEPDPETPSTTESAPEPQTSPTPEPVAPPMPKDADNPDWGSFCDGVADAGLICEHERIPAGWEPSRILLCCQRLIDFARWIRITSEE